jgi:excisionase family DNA binding protein
MKARGFTVAAAARYLPTVPAIRALIHKKELPFTRLGMRFSIDRIDLDRFLERRRKTK